MALIPVVCPTCGFSRPVPEASIPPGMVTVTCPACGRKFEFSKTAPAMPAAAPAQTPRTAPDAPPKAARQEPPGPVAESRDVEKSRAAARRKKRIVAAILAAVLIAVVTAAVWAHLFRLYPVLGEKLFIAGLLSNKPTIQTRAIRALRRYPTKHVALSLVLFINLKNMHQMPDPKKPENPEEKRKRERKRAEDLALAGEATETLCVLTGMGFGTAFKAAPQGHSWSPVDEGRWPGVLLEINSWAIRTFGPDDLSSFPLTFGDADQPAAGGAK